MALSIDLNIHGFINGPIYYRLYPPWTYIYPWLYPWTYTPMALSIDLYIQAFIHGPKYPWLYPWTYISSALSIDLYIQGFIHGPTIVPNMSAKNPRGLTSEDIKPHIIIDLHILTLSRASLLRSCVNTLSDGDDDCGCGIALKLLSH